MVEVNSYQSRGSQLVGSPIRDTIQQRICLHQIASNGRVRAISRMGWRRVLTG